MAKTCPHCGISDPAGLIGKSTSFKIAAAIALPLLIALAMCSGKSTTTSSANDRMSDAEFNTNQPSPISASVKDATLMRQWIAQNELCQGSSDETTIKSACPKRDATGTKLAHLGWCWAFPDKPSSESHWHRCAIDAPGATKDFVEQDVAFETGMAAGGSLGNQQAAETLQLHASPALRKIEQAIEPRSSDLGTAEAIVACGIRPKSWKDEIEKRLNASLESDPAYTDAIAELTNNEGSVAFAYSIAVTRSHKEFVVGNCKTSVGAPFLIGFDRYAAGEVETLPDGVGRVGVVTH